MQTETGLENVQAVSPGMVEAGQFGYASETKTAESEEIRHSEQYVVIRSLLIHPRFLDVKWPLILVANRGRGARDDPPSPAL